MGRHHLVRVGSLGRVGRFTSVDATLYPRHSRVIVRTSRGLELGEVLSPPEHEPDSGRADGSLLRGMTVADQLLAVRLERNRKAAFAACTARLTERKLPATLMDVEHLFDGRTLLFYFLGDSTPELEALTSELAELYEAQVEFRKFATAVSEGCGPDCGSDAASGCQSCGAGCAIAGACSSRHHEAPPPNGPELPSAPNHTPAQASHSPT